MTEPQAFEAIERMRQMFPTWSAWVLNKGNPDQVFRDFSQSIKPLPYDDVIAALDRMKKAQELPGKFERWFFGMVSHPFQKYVFVNVHNTFHLVEPFRVNLG